MRNLKFTFLNRYLQIINQNKRKALLFINIGIFFSIFAVSSAIVSFFIEKKISDNQQELIYTQIFADETDSNIRQMEFMVSQMETSFGLEERYRVEKQFLSETKLGNKAISTKDFYGPYIYITLETFKDLENLFLEDGYNPFDINDPFNQELINSIKGSWDDEDVNDFKNKIINFGKSYKEIKFFEKNDYLYDEIPSLKNISQEILNWKEHHLLHSTDELENIYTLCTEAVVAATEWSKTILSYMKGTRSSNDDEIEKLNSEILKLSAQEKKIILITFILQFIVFVIIQFFEINSFKSIIKKN